VFCSCYSLFFSILFFFFLVIVSVIHCVCVCSGGSFFWFLISEACVSVVQDPHGKQLIDNLMKEIKKHPDVPSSALFFFGSHTLSNVFGCCGFAVDAVLGCVVVGYGCVLLVCCCVLMRVVGCIFWFQF
jgi:hypothetical protein